MIFYCQLFGHFTIREANILWRFIKNDIKDTIVPSLISFLTAWLYDEHAWKSFPLRLLFSLGYAALYIYTFCLANQVNSVDEDQINKPERPLPSGLVTRRETVQRIIVYNVLFLAAAYLLHIFWISVGWQLVTAALNYWGWSNHWISKNHVCMSVGTFLLFSGQWTIATPQVAMSMSSYLYFGLLSLWAGFSLAIQDFRDEEGDRKMGRKTLTISMGNIRGRLVMVFQYLIFSPLIFTAAILTQTSISELRRAPLVMLILLVQLAIHWLIAYRIWFFRNPKADDFTYHVFVYLFCAAVPVLCLIR
ncbi:UbiA family prenyltransferase [Chitinophaga defluvii]|uniref:UbiA family prenyltransferase n=1 Tax=Chitinophaga defluvii TaxID=3163343 RepID=A0ABV2TC91_9BACT